MNQASSKPPKKSSELSFNLGDRPDVILKILTGLIPIPGKQYINLLVISLLRISENVAWTQTEEAIAAGWPKLDDLRLLKAGLTALPELAKTEFITKEKPKLHHFGRTYPVFTTLCDSRDLLGPVWIEQARAILVLIACQWKNENATVVQLIASTIRGARKGSNSEYIYAPLAGAVTISSLISRAENLDLNSTEGMDQAWTKHALPLLKRLASKAEVAKPNTTPGPHGPSPGVGVEVDPDEEQHPTPVVLRLPGKIPPNAPASERAEAPSDIVEDAEFFDVPQPKKISSEQIHVAEFRAKQSIWSKNSMLLVEHHDALSPEQAGKLGRFLISEIPLLLIAGQLAHARTLVRLIMSICTGKAAKALCAGRVLGKNDVEPSEIRWLLDLGKARIVQQVMRPESSFQPSVAESLWLENTVNTLSLYLVPSLASILRHSHEQGIDIFTNNVEDMQTDLWRACMFASEKLGFRVTPGRARRALICLLQDTGRDLAATMWIANDTLGQSTAPLYYTAAQARPLQEIYVNVLAILFGGEAPDLPYDNTRIGAKLLVKANKRNELSAVLGREIFSGISKSGTDEDVLRTHHALVDHIIGMLLDATGHRPSNALFDIRRGDIDTLGYCAIFKDKRFGACRRRFVAIPNVLSQQLEAYLTHLRALKSHVSKSTQRHIDQVLADKMPILFKLDSNGTVIELSMAAWMKNAPAAWQSLPPNFGRTTIATRGRDLGAKPEMLSIQLGHYEAVGYPFSDSSPTVPILFAEQLAPTLHRLARSGGWRCIQGLSTDAPENIWNTLGRLRNWTKELEIHEKAEYAELKEARTALRAEGRAARQVGTELAQKAITEAAPKLGESLKSGKAPGVELEILNRDSIRVIQQALIEHANGDSVLTYVGLEALRRQLLLARNKFSWSGFVPWRWRIVRRNEGTPFFPGMMIARRHIEELRAHFETLAKDPPAGIDAACWQVAKTALALLLFGFIESEDELIGVLQARKHVKRMVRIPDLLVIQWRDSPRKVSAFRGIAALSLASSTHLDCMMDIEQLNILLPMLLPAGSIGASESAVQLLCSMVCVTNRIEMSGAARFAGRADKGSVPADIHRQIAWFDDDPATPNGSQCDDDSTNAPLDAVEEFQIHVPDAHTGKLDSYAQYKLLLRQFPSTSTDTNLVLTKTVIKAANVEGSRKLLINEIAAWANYNQLNENVRALASWAHKMLTVGTLERSDPALKTVKDYVSAIGSDLIPLAGERIISEMDESELSDLLIETVEIKPSMRSKILAAREVRHFYNVVSARFSLAEADLDELNFYNGKGEGEDSVDSSIFLRQEILVALKLLELGEVGKIAARMDEPTRRRTERQAHEALTLLYASGARQGEVVGSRSKSLLLESELICLQIAKNRNRRVKTPAATRSNFIAHRLDPESKDSLSDWYKGEMTRLPAWKQEHAYLFSAVDSGRDLSIRPALVETIRSALRFATGRNNARIHSTRHLVASEFFAWTTLNSIDRDRVGWLKPLSSQAIHEEGVLFPRDYARHTVLLGHANTRTTIRVYLQFGWVLHARSDTWIQNRLNRKSASVCMGISVNGVDRISQRNKTVVSEQAWMDHVSSPRVIPLPRSISLSSNSGLVTTNAFDLSVRDVGRILGWNERGAPLHSALLAGGATERQTRCLGDAVAQLKARTGIVMYGDEKQLRKHGGVRRVASGNYLYQLWDVVDENEQKILVRVANAMYAHGVKMKTDELVLPLKEAELLRDLLYRHKQEPDSISLESNQDGFSCTLRVARPSVANRYLGKDLKRVLCVIWIHARAKELALH